MSSESLVLDASALLGYIYGEEEHGEVGSALRSGSLVTTLQLGEVYYILLQEEGREKARSALALLKNADLEIVSVDEELALEAGEIKVRTGIPYADSLAAGLAKTTSGILITGDRDFERLREGYEIEVSWVGGSE
ncbi:MAG: PIN domain-containing protein [Candidatus Bipolaricaulota bacterium]